MTPVSFDEQPIAAILDGPGAATRFQIGAKLWGFGGVHGGLALGLLTAAMRHRAPGRVLRYVSAQFKRPLRDAFEIELSDHEVGKTVSWLSARAQSNGFAVVTASAVFAEPGRLDAAQVSPPMPPAPPPADCPVFTVPPEFVPFARRTEIRPVGTARPFIGAAEPELMAWLRLVDDEVPPDDVRLMVLIDSLPPSYAAVLHAPVPIPTVTCSVAPGAALAAAASPWILLRARTGAASRDGWLVEQIDAWGPDGQHLGAAEQLRVVAAKR
jgi:hypothetical protein